MLLVPVEKTGGQPSVETGKTQSRKKVIRDFMARSLAGGMPLNARKKNEQTIIL